MKSVLNHISQYYIWFSSNSRGISTVGGGVGVGEVDISCVN